MTMRGACKLRTICEVLREINDFMQPDITVADKEKAVIRHKLGEAEAMAKKMDSKLLKYAKKYHKKFFADNPEYELALQRRMNERYVTE